MPEAQNSPRQGKLTPIAAAMMRKPLLLLSVWRQKPVSFAMMFFMPLVFAGMIGHFLYEAGAFSYWLQPQLTVESIEISTTKVTLVKPKLTRFDKKARTYIIRAQTAERYENKPDLIFLKEVDIEIRMARSKDKVFVTAKTGQLNSKTDELDLNGNILVRSTTGYRATLSTARLWLKQGRIVSNAPVVVYMPRGTVAANGVEIRDNGRNLRFFNRARMILEGKKGKPDAG